MASDEEVDDGLIMFGAHEPQQQEEALVGGGGGAAGALDSSVEWLDPELRRLSMEADQVELPFGFSSPLLDGGAPAGARRAREAEEAGGADSGSDTVAVDAEPSGPKS